MSFPEQIPFNGVDYFLYQLDRMMYQSSGNRNICTFVVELENSLESQQLQQILADSPAYRWITSLRIQQGLPFTLVRWCSDPDVGCPEILEHQLSEKSDLPDQLIGQSLDIGKESPFKIDIVQTKEQGTRLIFTWHHALMDAHGAERFIHSLGAADKTNQPDWVCTMAADDQMSLRQKAMFAHQMKKTLYETSKLPLLSLYKTQRPGSKVSYRLEYFSKQETEYIALRSREQGAGFLSSAFHLAVTARTVASIQQQREPLVGDIMVPVPQDRRKRGSAGAVLGNQATFIFHRIPQAALANLGQCTAELVKQMVTFIRSDIPGNYLIMMNMIKRVPGPLYRYLMKSPTGGLMGSFFYSDTGDTLQDYTKLFSRKVHGAVHYPPNTCPPGITFIYTRFHGALQISIGYMESVINSTELDLLVKHLRADLLGTNIDSALNIN